MTEKEVIIDGIDVSGCEYYQIEANELYPKAQYCGSMRNTFCENEPNCYYKQLKRLKQKLDKIKGIAIKYSQHEGYLLDGLFTDLVDELNEVLKNE